MNIKNQIAIITGGASGMGAETARYLTEHGAKVALLDRDETQVKKHAESIDALPIACDVTCAEDVTAAFKIIEKQLGTPRICVNCAGIVSGSLIVAKDHTPMPLDSFAQIINVNLVGTFNVMRVAAAVMSTQETTEGGEERGVIINTASIAAYEGQIGQAAYSASKGGIVALTLPAARELARHAIRVMTIAPGLVETPMLEGLPDKVRDALIQNVPFPKRFAKTNEFAQLVKQIIENPMLNGSTIRLDGALRMTAK